LEPLRRASGLVFGWENWPQAESTFTKHRIRQQEGAGIRPLSLYGLRRSFSTQCGKINPLAMGIMMNHIPPGLQMAADYYAWAEDILADALSKMPQPGKATQQRLF